MWEAKQMPIKVFGIKVQDTLIQTHVLKRQAFI